MSEYLIVGGTTLLGQDSSGQYKLLPVPIGDPDRIAAMGEDAIKGGAPRSVNMALQRGDTYVDVENLPNDEKSKLRGIAEDLTKSSDGSGGAMAFFTRSSMSDKINKLIDAISKVGGKTGGIMGLVDILGMKKDFDEIRKGESLINKLIPTEKEFSKQVFKDGGVIDIFDTD